MSVFISHSSIEEQVISGLAKSYSTLDYSLKLKSILGSVYPGVDFTKYNKFELHEIVSKTIWRNYNGEHVLKYLLFKEFARKKVIAAFEMKVNSSRVDFLTINGFTKSFEIKSGIDNLQKLKKQATDYMRVFEYNFIVIDERHLTKALAILPDSYGVWSFEGRKKKIHRDAELNTKLDSEYQLRLLTKKELKVAFKADNIASILKDYDEHAINLQFKTVLKERYKTRWEFIVNNNSKILPVDLQFFFNTNVLPELIYQD